MTFVARLCLACKHKKKRHTVYCQDKRCLCLLSNEECDNPLYQSRIDAQRVRLLEHKRKRNAEAQERHREKMKKVKTVLKLPRRPTS